MTNLILLILSICFSLVIGEGLVRLVLDPLDYLRPHTIYDPWLRSQKVQPGSAGHDAWGYRNSFVPTSVDIVAIGDSQTYGVSAIASDSWPSQLQRVAQKSVYNLSLGGYNPFQYYLLLESKAFKLTPQIIIVGFYYGNDLIGAYSSTQPTSRTKHDSISGSQRQRSSDNSQFNKGPRLISRTRNALSHRSILYRLVTHSFANTMNFVEVKYLKRERDDITVLDQGHPRIKTAFTPFRRLVALDLEDPKVAKGLDISLDLFTQMNQLSQRNGKKFLVVLIPTKESVFARYIENQPRLKNSSEINRLIRYERKINDLAKSYLRENKIRYVDTLANLSQAVGKKIIYPSNEGGHPTKEGYQIIAETVYSSLLDFEG